MRYVDLHTHTLASDGRLTPTQLVKKAKKLGILYLAKTDHDNVDLMDEFMRAGKKYKIQTIPGIEISSRYQQKSVHIVGLGINPKNKKLAEYARKCRLARRERAYKIAQKLKQIGFKLKLEEMRRKVITRPHVADAVIKHPANRARLIKEFGHIPSFSDFIKKYMTPDGPAFVRKKFYLPVRPAIQLIRQAGGLAIIAHPCSKTAEFSYSRRHLNELIKLKFDGIEAYNFDNTREEIKYLLKLAKNNNLLISAGTDYHGLDSEFKLGICDAGKYVGEEKCRELIERLRIAR